MVTGVAVELAASRIERFLNCREAISGGRFGDSDVARRENQPDLRRVFGRPAAVAAEPLHRDAAREDPLEERREAPRAPADQSIVFLRQHRAADHDFDRQVHVRP